MAKQAARMRLSAPPEHNALRSRGCPNPDRALVRRRREVPAPRKANITRTAEMPIGFRVESIRREWQAAVAQTRKLKAAGENYATAAARARELRAQLVRLDPDLAVSGREIEVSQGSASNKVKAVD